MNCPVCKERLNSKLIFEEVSPIVDDVYQSYYCKNDHYACLEYKDFALKDTVNLEDLFC